MNPTERNAKIKSVAERPGSIVNRGRRHADLLSVVSEIVQFLAVLAASTFSSTTRPCRLTHSLTLPAAIYSVPLSHRVVDSIFPVVLFPFRKNRTRCQNHTRSNRMNHCHRLRSASVLDGDFM